jgi:hypothetical protein
VRGDTLAPPMRTLSSKRCARCVASFLALLLAAPASGAPVPFSYLDLEVHDTAVDGRIRVHLVDLAPVLGLADPRDLLRPECASPHRARSNATSPRASRSRTAGSSARDGAGMASGRRRRGDRADLLDPGPPEARSRSTTNLFPADPNHQTFVNVYEDGDCASSSSSRATTDPSPTTAAPPPAPSR